MIHFTFAVYGIMTANVVAASPMVRFWILGYLAFSVVCDFIDNKLTPNSRWGYRDAFEVAEVIANYSKAEIPLETMWTDIG